MSSVFSQSLQFRLTFAPHLSSWAQRHERHDAASCSEKFKDNNIPRIMRDSAAIEEALCSMVVLYLETNLFQFSSPLLLSYSWESTELHHFWGSLYIYIHRHLLMRICISRKYGTCMHVHKLTPLICWVHKLPRLRGLGWSPTHRDLERSASDESETGSSER